MRTPLGRRKLSHKLQVTCYNTPKLILADSLTLERLKYFGWYWHDCYKLPSNLAASCLVLRFIVVRPWWCEGSGSALIFVKRASNIPCKLCFWGICWIFSFVLAELVVWWYYSCYICCFLLRNKRSWIVPAAAYIQVILPIASPHSIFFGPSPALTRGMWWQSGFSGEEHSNEWNVAFKKSLWQYQFFFNFGGVRRANMTKIWVHTKPSTQPP